MGIVVDVSWAWHGVEGVEFVAVKSGRGLIVAGLY
jgi:hypothetical protein